MKDYVIRIKTKTGAYINNIGSSLLNFISSFDIIKDAIKFYRENLADLNRGWSYIAVLSVCFKFISSIILYLFFDYQEDSIRQFIGQLGLIVFLFGIIYYYFKDTVEFYLNRFIIKLLSVKFIANYTMIYGLMGIVTDRYQPYVGMEGTDTENCTKKERYSYLFNGILVVYFLPMLLLTLSIMISLPYFFFIGYTFFLVLVRFIIRAINFSQEDTVLNLEFIRRIMTDEEYAQLMIFETIKFRELDKSVQEFYLFLYKLCKEQSGNFETRLQGFVVLFIFCITLFLNYNSVIINILYTKYLLNKFERLKVQYYSQMEKNSDLNQNSDNLFKEFPKLNENTILLAGGGTFRTMKRTAGGAFGAGSVGYGFYKLKHHEDLKHHKNIAKINEESNRNIAKINEESNRNMVNNVVEANNNDYKNQVQNSLEFVDQLRAKGFNNDQIAPLIPKLQYNNVAIPNKNQEAIKIMNSVREDFKMKSVLENSENTKSIWLVVKELARDIFF